MAYPSSLPAEFEDEGVIMDLPALIADLSG